MTPDAADTAGQLAVRRLGRGRPRTRPAAVIDDRAYSSRGTRAMQVTSCRRRRGGGNQRAEHHRRHHGLNYNDEGSPVIHHVTGLDRSFRRHNRSPGPSARLRSPGSTASHSTTRGSWWIRGCCQRPPLSARTDPCTSIRTRFRRGRGCFGCSHVWRAPPRPLPSPHAQRK
jgi:hypothetical protein